MTAATATHRLLRLVRGRPVAPQPDFADLGTAFGLDLAVLPLEPAAQAAARSRRTTWWKRLLGRGAGR